MPGRHCLDCRVASQTLFPGAVVGLYLLHLVDADQVVQFVTLESRLKGPMVVVDVDVVRFGVERRLDQVVGQTVPDGVHYFRKVFPLVVDEQCHKLEPDISRTIYTSSSH